MVDARPSGSPAGSDNESAAGEQPRRCANRQIAGFRRDEVVPEELLPTEDVATPGTSTIEELSSLLGIPASRTAKAVFMVAEINDEQSKFVFGIIRGDLDMNETKLANAAGARALRPARPEGYHTRNVNYGWDFNATTVTDIVAEGRLTLP